MNIIVDLNYPIQDGAEVKFRSPVDCSQVTGLIVNYNGGSQEFIFADAHGNNVGDIDHLFAEDVVVKVILDVTTGMAFVQNADTNAYLEGRFAELEGKIGTGGDSTALNEHLDNKENPHSVTLEQIGAVPMSEIGDKEEIFKVATSILDGSENHYLDNTGDWIEQDGCGVYLFGADGNYDGKTITIRTYMYGDMAFMKRNFDYPQPESYFCNEGVTAEDVAQNPERGIFEYTHTFTDFNENEHDGTHFHISFCENPYMSQPEVIVHKGSVWEEIKNLQSVEGYDIAEAAATAVRYTAQSLTDTQKAQARANIGAVTLDDVLEALPIYNGEVEEV